MELVYTNQLDGFEPGKRYRVPGLFRNVERDVTAVTVVGDYPNIVSAYEDTGVDVEVVELPPANTVAVVGDRTVLSGDLTELLAELRAERGAVVLLIDGLEAGEIHRPESGELALRLFDVLGAVHATVVELATERDGLRTAVGELRGEVEALKKAAIVPPADEAGEVAALKAKLDKAEVPYRANVSKDSLEKLVAELPKE